MNPSIDRIKNSALKVSEDSRSSNINKKKRAKESISQLTSEERKFLLKIINSTENSPILPKHQKLISSIDAKLLKIENDDPIIREKDLGLNRAEKSLMGVWRGN